MARTRHMVLLADPPMVRDALRPLGVKASYAPIARGANALGLWAEVPRPTSPRLPGWSASADLGSVRVELLESGEWTLAAELSQSLQTAAAAFLCDDARPIAAGVFEAGELVAFRCEGLEQNRQGALSKAEGDVEAGVDGVLAAVVAEGQSKGLARLIATEDFSRRVPL